MYNEVIKAVLNDIKNYESTTELTTHIVNLLELYNSDLQVDSPDVKYLREIVYQESLELFGRILSDGALFESLSENGAIEQLLSDFTNTQNTRIVKAQLDLDSRKEFFALMEKAQILASVGDLTGAINEFETAIEFGDEELGEKTYAEHWKCLTYNRSLISNGTYTMDKLDSLLKECPEIVFVDEEMSSLRVINPLSNDSLRGDNKISILGYPNPTNGSVLFSITLAKTSEVIYNIIDINGRIVNVNKPVVLEKGTSNLNVDFSNYPNGIYNCIIKINSEIFNNKIVVIR